MSNENYPFSYISRLNAINQEPTEMFADDFAAEEFEDLSCWATTEFNDATPSIGLFENFDVTPKDSKLEEEAPPVTVQHTFPNFMSQLALNQTQPVISGMAPLFFATQTPILQQIPITTTGGNTAGFPIIVPPLSTTATVTVPSNITSNNNNSSNNNSTRILPKQPTSPIKTRTEQKIAPAPSATPNRKSSSVTPKSATSQTQKLSTKDDQMADVKKATSKSTTAATTATSDPDDEEESKKTFDQDSAAKLAAEEDKRRRNTAASARFRVKKKLREQALEQTAKEMTTKAEVLERKVKDLELEIKWLRSLIVEKDPRLLDTERPEKRRKTDSTE